MKKDIVEFVNNKSEFVEFGYTEDGMEIRTSEMHSLLMQMITGTDYDEAFDEIFYEVTDMSETLSHIEETCCDDENYAAIRFQFDKVIKGKEISKMYEVSVEYDRSILIFFK